jgi:hypothetical protein
MSSEETASERTEDKVTTEDKELKMQTTAEGSINPNKEEEQAKVAEGQELQVLPENEAEEKEEILLTSTTGPETTKSKAPSLSSKTKSSSKRVQPTEMNLTGVSKQLDKQTVQIDKIRLMLQSIQTRTKTIERQPELIKQLQSQIKQIQKHVLQIQKSIRTKKK